MRTKTKVRMVVLALGLAACGGGAKDAKPPAEPVAAKTMPVATVEAPDAAPGPPEQATSADGVDASTGIPECDRYLATARRLIACDKVPPEARKAQQQALDAAEQGWKSLADTDVPADAKKAAADACREGADALEQAMTQLKCRAAAP